MKLERKIPTDVVITIGDSEIKHFEDFNALKKFVEEREFEIWRDLNKRDEFNSILFKMSFSAPQRTPEGEFVYRVLYRLKKEDDLRKVGRCNGYDHNGGSHTLSMELTMSEFEILIKEIEKASDKVRNKYALQISYFHLVLSKMKVLEMDFINGKISVSDIEEYNRKLWINFWERD
jgi:hypothetical protein